MRRSQVAPRAVIVAATFVASFSGSGAASAADVDVVVDSTDITLSSGDGGKHTAAVTLLNISDAPVILRASIPGDEGCTITPDPTSVQSGRRVTVTLTLGQGCDVETGADVNLRFGPQVNPTGYVVNATPAPANELRWPILGWSLPIAAAFAALTVGWVLLRMRARNNLKHSGPTIGGPTAPAASAKDPGSVPAGFYRYAIAFVTHEGETLGAQSNVLELQAPRQVGLTEIVTGPETTIARRIYRSENGGDFIRVGEIPNNTETVYNDNWQELAWSTPLRSLGTEWSFKENWVSSVTVGSGVLVALLAASNVLEAVLGFEPKAALTLMAVTGAIAAVLVGISPLFVKWFGDDQSIPTVAGTLVAAFVTLVGAIGQISVVTWLGSELATGWVRWVILGAGVAIGAVVILYAKSALWYYIWTGAAVSLPTKPDVLEGAEVVATAIARTTGEIRPDVQFAPQPVRAEGNSLL